MNLYRQYSTFYLAVDCIIFGFNGLELKILLIKRNFEPQKGKWSLMGGFLQQDESLDGAAERILFQLTGLRDVYLEQLYTYGDMNRDSEDRVISTAYYALIKIDNSKESEVNKHQAAWFEISNFPELIFDHNQMVDKALRRLRRKSRTQPLGFELLPEKFTLPQLQHLYEAIHQKEFDKRNFRKKILSFDVLLKLDEKDKAGSKKGAYLYKFDEKKYDALMSDGAQFVL